MCGITGIFNVDGRPADTKALQEMTDVIRHRGPDGEGLWAQDFIGFGHRRLAILDLTPAGSQPMENDDRSLVVTYNGEVYNFRELRAELEAKGFRFTSRSDTEVVLKAYQAYGQGCLDKFNGMFAFAVWSRESREIFLARDRYGIKPLYYWFDGKTLAFASEIKSLLKCPGIGVDVEPEALLEYFTFQNIFTYRTMFKNIKVLPPGHYLTLKLGEPGSFCLHRYWDYSFSESKDKICLNEYMEELDRLFRQAVRRQLVSDVEVGAYLSGGMDSGAITSIAARQIPQLSTFTVGFDLSSASGLELAFDERKKAEHLSYLYKTEHYEVVLKAGDMERIMPKLIWHLEDLRVGQCYPNFYISRLAGKFVKVVLSGIGGDELFAGYPWRYYRAVSNDSFEDYVQKYYVFWQRLIPNSFMPRLFRPDIWEKMKHFMTIEVFRDVFGGGTTAPHIPEDYVNRSLYFEAKTFLHGLFIVEDKLSMANSLETRVPFMDNDLVDFAMKVPVSCKLKNLDHVVRINENELQKRSKFYEANDDGKIILREMLMRYVPREIAEQKKQGFSAPDASWFRGESLNYIRSLLLDAKAEINTYFQREFVEQMINEHTSGRNNRRLFLWSLLCFEWWLRIFKTKSVSV